MVKLKRAFNIFDPAVWKRVGMVFGLSLLLLTFLYFIGGFDTSLLAAIVFLAIFFPVFVIIECFCQPKQLFFDEKGVRFSIYQGVRVFKKYRYVRVDYDVIGLKDVVFSQSKIEKHFGVGHITFSGVVYFEARRYADRIKPKSRFTIYGIPEFSRFIEEFPHK